MSTLDEVAADVYIWFTELKALGIDLAESAPLKTLHEAKEFSDDPSLEEAADVFIALVGACSGRQWDYRDLARAAYDKMRVNWNRQWEKKPDGTWQHVDQG